MAGVALPGRQHGGWYLQSIRPKIAFAGLYGFFQMGYGMLCTIAIASWNPGSVFPVAAILLGSTLTSFCVLNLTGRRA